MANMEIWVPETVIVVFLALPLLRPFVKALWNLDGLQWLPLIGLAITAGIFPAYGFRPECLPMLVFALVFNIANLPSFFSSLASRTNDSLFDRGPLLTVCAFVLLGITALPMFVFSPKAYTGSFSEFEPVKTVTLSSSGRNYFVRIYEADKPTDTIDTPNPVIFLVPPEIGSASSVDLVCAELREKGYTVVSYARQDYDVPAIDENGRKQFPSPAKLAGYWHIFRRAAVSVSANERGKALESERRADIEYVLPQLPALLESAAPLILAGYGAGGSALAYLAGESDFAASNTNVLGVIAVEGRLWSSYIPEHRDWFKAPAVKSKFTHQLADFIGDLNRALPQQLSRKGPLPDTGLPLLYLLSGRVLDSRKGQKPYQAVFDTLRSGAGPVAITAVEGAGPLDYQDFPFTHPICSFFLPGLKGAAKSENPVSDTAGIIGNFASWLIEQSGTESFIPSRSPLSGTLYVESKAMPELRF